MAGDVQNSNYQAVVTRTQDANYIWRKFEEYEKWGLKINGRITESVRKDSEELQSNRNTIPTLKQFEYSASIVQKMVHLSLKFKKGSVKQK